MAVPAPHDAQRVAAVRRFNRFYTQHLGVLQDGWLDSPFSLTEARVLYEIKQRDRATATDIGRDLGLDAGYLSRILRRFHKSGLIRKDVSPDDARQSLLSITARGQQGLRSARSADRAAGRRGARPAGRAGAGPSGLGDARDRDDDRAGADSRRARSSCASHGPATSAGWSPATPSSTPRNTAGAKTSRASARRSSPTSPASTIRHASAAGSPKWTAGMSARCFWSRIPRRSRGCACCWSIRWRAGAGSARG